MPPEPTAGTGSASPSRLASTDVEGFTIRRAEPSDAAVVRSLLREHLGEGYDVASRYEWLYRQNPHGHARTWIAMDEASGEPAGLTSLFPRRVLVRGEERLGSIGGDGFVRPAFRRRGIATALHRACLRGMSEDGIELMYGPPEPHNLAALLRAGSQIVCQLRRFVRPLDIRKWAGLGPALSPLRGWLAPKRSALRLRPFLPDDGQRLDRLWERVAPDLTVAPVRDASFYAWRFAGSPSGRQRAYLVLDGNDVIGACALERDGARTVILDIVAPRRAASLVVSAITWFCRHDVAVEVRLNERGPVASHLWRQGFVPRDRKAFQVMVSDHHPRVDELRRPQAWYYTTGDGDLDTVLSHR